MKNLNAAAFDRFEKVPTTALTDITPPENNIPLGDSIISDNDVFQTAEHAKTSFIPTASDAPNDPTQPIGGAPIPTTQQGIKLGSTVSGKFAVDMSDIVIPALLVWLISMIGYGIDKKQLSLSAKEKETLTPLVQAYLDSINVNFNNPLNNLLFGIAMVYGSKIMEIIPTAQKLEKKGKPNPKESAIATVVKMVQDKKPTDKILEELAKKRKKGMKDAIEYFNANKKQFGKENEPDIKLP